MICLVFAQSRLQVATLIFYTCVLIPIFQLKQALLSLIGLVSRTCHPTETFHLSCLEGTWLEQQFVEDLPVVRFGDLETLDERVEEGCSVCLGDFEREDEVSQLSRCGHVFHLRCIKSWLDRDRFTCPLCRSFILNVDVLHGNCGIPDHFNF